MEQVSDFNMSVPSNIKLGGCSGAENGMARTKTEKAWKVGEWLGISTRNMWRHNLELKEVQTGSMTIRNKCQETNNKGSRSR